MKKSLQILALLFICLINAQAPEKFSYQAVIRNATNTLVTNSPVGVKISILKNSSSGNVVYAETQNASTNANGLISLQIGAGTVITGSIAGIDWSADSYYIKTETDPSGGSNYSISGTSQLLSVPYAMYSKSSGSGASSFSLPYSGTSSADNVIPFKITNSSTSQNQAGYFENMDVLNSAPAISGKNNSVDGFGVGVQGVANSNTNGNVSAGVSGYVSGTGNAGTGVLGQSENAYGVYGLTTNGLAVRGLAFGTGTAGSFQANTADSYALVTYGPIKFLGVNEGVGKVLTYDSNGNASWQDVVTPFVNFSSLGGSAQSIPNSIATVINTWTQLEETGGANYNASTGEYTIPVTGYYKISAKISFYYPNDFDGSQAVLGILVNSSLIKQGFSNSAINGKYYSDPAISIAKKLNQGDKISFIAYQNGKVTNDLYSLGTTFSIDLLHK